MSHIREGSSVNRSSENLLSAQSLLNDPSTRRTILEALSIATLLGGCIIGQSYKARDSLVQPVILSNLGRATFDEIRRASPRLKPNEVKLAVFLAFGCSAGLMVDKRTDVEALRKALSDEMLERRIFFPYIFGRDLHDKAASMYPEKWELSNQETVKLLSILPIGVYQDGYTTTGPLGCIISDAYRTMPPAPQAPAYYCSDPTCQVIHPISLMSASQKPAMAAIHHAGNAVDEYLRREYGASDNPYSKMLWVAKGQEQSPLHIRLPEATFDTIADALTLAELQAVVAVAIRVHSRKHGPNLLAKRMSTVIGNPEDYTSSVDRATLLQVALLVSDAVLMDAIDEVISQGLVTFPDGEVRRGRLARWTNPSYALELGLRGARLAGPPGHTADMLYQLLHHLYFESGVLEPADLQYYLSDMPVDSEPLEALNLAVHNLSTTQILRDLVVGNRRAAGEAVSHLGISSPPKDREELLQLLLWKLGAPSDIAFPGLARVMHHTNEAREALTVLPRDVDLLRGRLSNLYNAVEDTIQQSIAFVTWALSVDHYTTDSGFVYNPEQGTQWINYLDEKSPTSDPVLALKKNGRNTLQPLAAGFARLSKAFKSLSYLDHQRPEDQVPLLCRFGPRPFAFNSDVPFLNLSTSGQASIIAGLEAAGRLVQDANVLAVRNSSIHGNNLFPTDAEIALALERLDEWCRVLSEPGLYPRIFTFKETMRDSLGRTQRTYESGEETCVLFQPTWALAPKMPNGSDRLIIMPTALTPAAGPMRFSIAARYTEDPYWAGWPKRWRVEEQYKSATMPEEFQQPPQQSSQ